MTAKARVRAVVASRGVGALQRCALCDTPGKDSPDAASPEYLCCPSCGAWFRRSRPSLGELVEKRNGVFADAFALPHHEEKRRARDESLAVMRGYFAIRRSKPAALNAFGLSVLDVQCELGFRLRVFANYGWSVVGTETSATAYEYARRQSLEVKHGWLDEVGFGDARFDLAILCGDFGELPKPKALLAKLASLLKPRALVYLCRQRVLLDGEPAVENGALFVYTADCLRRLFCERFFALVSEEEEGETRDFWFELKGGK